jgi:hypothetical protein
MKARALFLTTLVCLMSLASSAALASDDADLGFEAAFPRSLYEKKVFSLAITGASITAAGAFSYFTAGAGAPAAATGVSSVASWVAGGGAGSYMAGLSTIGGWFGGNAMLGSAILNGISLGTVGGMGSWSSLSVSQKVLALSATAATAMDGIVVISNPSSGQLEWRVMLPVPADLADDRISQLVKVLSQTSAKLAALRLKLDAAKSLSSEQGASKASAKDLNELQQELAATEGRHKETSRQVDAEISHALKSGDTIRNTVVLAVLAHNLGRSKEFRTLIGRIKPSKASRRSYLDYLRAIAALQTGKVAEAESLLYGVVKAAKFVIEPPILLASVLGGRGFAAQEAKINEISRYADLNFDSDAYVPAASLVSMHFRIGSMALKAKRCDRALYEFKKAQSAQSMIEEYWTRKDIRNLLDVGEANALHCQDKKSDAAALFKQVLSRASTKDARDLLCMQFSGGC